ncbi:MAG: hypothetical protein ACTS4Y_01645 [Candidatus Hodgkinia cicadicola]
MKSASTRISVCHDPDQAHRLNRDVNRHVNGITGYSPVKLFLVRQLYRAEDWHIETATAELAAKLAECHRKYELQVNRIWEEVRRRALKDDMEEDGALKPGVLVLWKNHCPNNKADGYYAELVQKWFGPFQVDKQLGEGVYLLKTSPPVKVHTLELWLVKQLYVQQ